jgi:uncharacterized protein (UPF0276 family)
LSDDQISIGISVADFSPGRGVTDLRVWELADHVEYGGYQPPRSDIDMATALGTHPMPVGRHLVRTELSEPMDAAKEAEKIAGDISPYRVEYFLTDAELWMCGFGNSATLWARPYQLSMQRARLAAANAQALSVSLKIPVLVENPALIYSVGDCGIDDFLCAVAESGGQVCLDVGHFYATVCNSEQSLRDTWDRLPFAAIRVAHIAGLSQVDYLNRRLLIDNHDITPLPQCFELLAELVRRAAGLRWITYEAELAPTDVQLSGLLRVRDAVRKAKHA